MESSKSILLVAQKSAAKDEPTADDLYPVGCIANILQMLKLPDGTVKVLVEGAPTRSYRPRRRPAHAVRGRGQRYRLERW